MNDEGHTVFLSHLEKQLEHTNYWLAFAEAKNAALLALNIAVIAVCSDMYSRDSSDRVSMQILFITILFYIVSSAIALVSFSPNMATKSKADVAVSLFQDRNLLFYGNIALIPSAKDLLKQVRDKYFIDMKITDKCLMENKLLIDLGDEIIINSQITTSKLKLFKIALTLDIVALFVVGVGLIIA